MKNNKGVTLTSLIIYVIGMVIVVASISTLTTFFYKNIDTSAINDNTTTQYTNKIKLCDNVERCEFSYKYQDTNYIINIEFKSGKVDKTGKNMMTYTIKNGK